MRRSKMIHEERLDDKSTFRAEVVYLMGGHNWFTGNQFERGYYLSVDVVERSPASTPGYVIETTVLGRGLKQLLVAAQRFSAKTLTDIQVDTAAISNIRAAALARAGISPESVTVSG